MAQLYKEAFERDIQENIFAGVDFLNTVISHDEYVENNKVHLPQAGTAPNVVEDRSTIPATVKKREDTYKSYALHELSTDPIVVKNLEQQQLTYNKRQSLMRDKMSVLRNRVANRAIYEWSGTGLVSNGGQIIRTSDATNADATANPPNATGDRKALTLDDISKAASVLDDQDIPLEGRYLIIPSKVYWNHLVPNNKEILNKDYNPTSDEDIRMGIVKKLYTFNIILRSKVVVYTNDSPPVKKAVGAVGEASDNFGIVGFQSDQVARALGDIDVFEYTKSPTYYGDVLSALVYFGATQLREDGKGIVTIVQEHTA